MTQALKITLIAIASAITSAVVVNQFTSHSCQVDVQHNESDLLLSTQLAQLQRENRQLHTQLKQLDSATSPLGQGTEKKQHQSVANTSHSLPEKPIMDESLLRKSENFSKWLASMHKESANFDLYKEMQRRFDTEVVDPEWATEEEQVYLSLFSQNQELSGLALRDTQCRTQQCAITVSITDLNQANQLVEKMALVLRQKNKYPMIIAAPDEQQGTTTLYIGKDENSFDFN